MLGFIAALRGAQCDVWREAVRCAFGHCHGAACGYEDRLGWRTGETAALCCHRGALDQAIVTKDNVIARRAVNVVTAVGAVGDVMTAVDIVVAATTVRPLDLPLPV